MRFLHPFLLWSAVLRCLAIQNPHSSQYADTTTTTITLTALPTLALCASYICGEDAAFKPLINTEVGQSFKECCECTFVAANHVFLGTYMEGKFDVQTRSLSLSFDIPSDVTISSITWNDSHDQSLSLAEGPWSTSSVNQCRTRYEITQPVQSFFGDGSEFTLSGTTLMTSIQIEASAQVDEGTIFERTYTEDVPILVGVETETTIEATFHMKTQNLTAEVFETSLVFYYNYTQVIGDHLEEFLAVCTAFLSPDAVCVGARNASIIEKDKSSNSRKSIGGSRQSSGSIIIDIESTTIGVLNATREGLMKEGLPTENDGTLFAERIMYGTEHVLKQLITAHITGNAEHMATDGSVLLTIEIATPGCIQNNASVVQGMEHIAWQSFSFSNSILVNNLCEQEVEFHFNPVQAFTDTIGIQFMTRENHAFVVDVDVNIHAGSILDYLPFDATMSFHADSTCQDEPQSEFLLGSEVYTLIEVSPLIALPLRSIDIVSFTLTQTDYSGIPETTDLMSEGWANFQANDFSEENKATVEFELESTHFHVSFAGELCEVRAEVQISYQDGVTVRRTLATRRRLSTQDAANSFRIAESSEETMVRLGTYEFSKVILLCFILVGFASLWVLHFTFSIIKQQQDEGELSRLLVEEI